MERRPVPRKKQDPTKEAPAKPRKRGPAKAAAPAPASSRSASDEPPPSSAGGAGREDEDDRDTGDDGEPEHADGDVIEVSGEVVDEDVQVDANESVAPASSDGGALSRRDPLQAYLREIQRHPLLTPEEEQRLTKHYQSTQDVNTAARLVTANLRLVVKLAYEYRRAYKNIMDLIQEGNIGLMQAVKRYDPYRGVKLSSYAAWWIRAYILRFILNNWRLVKLGTTQAQRKLFFNLNKEKAKLAAMGIDATPDVIAERLGVEEKEVVEMDRRLASAEASLDAPVGDAEGRSVSRVDLMPSATSGPEVLLERQEMDRMVHDRLQQFRAKLQGKDVIIFDKRMAAEDPLTLQELGDEFGISRERVRQLEARLTSKLRDFLKAELGDAVDSG
ncbi:MAG: RNA polymerase factor sigma-32 [Polyangiaceae bacterium]|nr:RNA polymerase factor sigma-32 [Polyangiaceae bacterium]